MDISAIVVFGGTAAYHIRPEDFATVIGQTMLETPYGRSPRFWQLQTPAGRTVWYGSRHGEGSLERSARFVNHRANLWAARELGAGLALSWNGVGAVNPALHVAEAVVPHGLMDWTRHRVATLGPQAPCFEEAESLRRAARSLDHVNAGRDPRRVAHPFHEPARKAILASLAQQQRRPAPLPSPTYVCTEGPRLETAAEIQLAARLGADVVGMTLCPEVWLAAELGLGYASLCLVTNFATGLRHLDPRREFGPAVATLALTTLLLAAERLHEDTR